MRTTIMAVMLAAPLSLGLLLVAAQAQEDPTTPPTPAPKHPCIDSPLRDLLANPAAVAVLNRDLPGMTSDPRLEMAKSMSLRQIARFPDAHLNGAKLKMLEADLEAAASALAAPSATASASDADTSAPASPR